MLRAINRRIGFFTAGIGYSSFASDRSCNGGGLVILMIGMSRPLAETCKRENSTILKTTSCVKDRKLTRISRQPLKVMQMSHQLSIAIRYRQCTPHLIALLGFIDGLREEIVKLVLEVAATCMRIEHINVSLAPRLTLLEL